MARVEVADVLDVLDTKIGDGQVGAFIDDASLWVDSNLSNDGLSVNLLTTIEKYLACHLVTLRDPRVTRVQHDDVVETYQRDQKANDYLKTAVALDPTGKVEGAFGTIDAQVQVRFRAGVGFVEEVDTELSP